ncbi:hypothetical protein GOV11_05375 [Candidatus Woesearchaeota archaeon]|nr:hypothetical protein [Candidatus Woesearchaeota archaeon]
MNTIEYLTKKYPDIDYTQAAVEHLKETSCIQSFYRDYVGVLLSGGELDSEKTAAFYVASELAFILEERSPEDKKRWIKALPPVKDALEELAKS